MGSSTAGVLSPFLQKKYADKTVSQLSQPWLAELKIHKKISAWEKWRLWSSGIAISTIRRWPWPMMIKITFSFRNLFTSQFIWLLLQVTATGFRFVEVQMINSWFSTAVICWQALLLLSCWCKHAASNLFRGSCSRPVLIGLLRKTITEQHIIRVLNFEQSATCTSTGSVIAGLIDPRACSVSWCLWTKFIPLGWKSFPPCNADLEADTCCWGVDWPNRLSTWPCDEMGSVCRSSDTVQPPVIVLNCVTQYKLIWDSPGHRLPNLKGNWKVKVNVIKISKIVKIFSGFAFTKIFSSFAF